MSYMFTSNFARTRPTFLAGVSDFLRLVAVLCFASCPPFCMQFEISNSNFINNKALNEADQEKKHAT